MTDANRLVLGTAQWGLSYGIANRTGPPSDDQLREMLEMAAAAHVDTLDTARAYPGSEPAIGRCGDERWRIVTKLDPDLGPPGAARESVAARVHASLRLSREALRRDRLDAVLLHRWAHRSAWGGAAWDELRVSRDRGDVGDVGVSATTPAEAFAALADPDVQLLQVAASLFDRRLARQGFFEAAASRGVEVHVRSIYLQGAAHLAVSDLPLHLAVLGPALEQLDQLAAVQSTTRGALVLAYARERIPGRPVVGTESPEQLRANLAAWHVKVDRARLDEMESWTTDLPDSVLDPWRWPSLPTHAATRHA